MSVSVSTIPALLQQSADTYGDKTFLEDGNTKISFAKFFSQCKQLAAVLIAEGIEKGDRIAVWAPNTIEWVIAALGAQCAGAVLVTLNTRYKAAEAAYILNKSKAKLLFSVGYFLDTDYPAELVKEDLPYLNKIVVFPSEQVSAAQHSNWHDFVSQNPDIDQTRIDQRINSVQADDLSDILFTSGTTGSPKGVMTCHGQNLRAFSTFGDVLGLQENDRYLVINPFFHSFGYKAGILASLLKGVTLLPHAVFDAALVLKRIGADQISVLPGPPTLFQTIMAHPEFGSTDISSLKRATTGAATIPVQLIHDMKAKMGFETVITAYGLTESCGLVTMCREGDTAEIIATTSGRVIPDVELRCVDTDNNAVASGEPGEIVVRGYNVMKGYFENEQATRETIDSDGWLHTGDIGVLDEQGNLKITDRLKDMFITGGFNCYPAEIENIISTHEAITMCAVIGVADERMGEVAMAFVVLKPEVSLEESALIKWCREKMANFKVPRKIAFVDSLPLNASGKVVKGELKKLA